MPSNHLILCPPLQGNFQDNSGYLRLGTNKCSYCLNLLIYYCCSVAQSCGLFVTPWTAARQASLSFTVSWRLLKLLSLESVMPSNCLILCCPLLLLPSIFPNIKVFSRGLVLRIRWPKYSSFSFSINPSNVYPGLISSRIVWFDLLAVQGYLFISIFN